MKNYGICIKLILYDLALNQNARILDTRYMHFIYIYIFICVVNSLQLWNAWLKFNEIKMYITLFI